MIKVEDFKQQLSVVESTRASVLMLIGLYGGSGSGKTVTALIWAIGMAGPDATIGIIDTEQKRATLAVDIAEKLALQFYGRSIPKPKLVHLEAPYHPLKYVAALDMLIDSKVSAIVVDSISHSWSGEGGYLDLKEEALSRMAGDDWKKREKCAMAAAAQVKPHTHSKLFQKVTHLPVPAILCFRAVEKTRIGKNSQNQTTIEKDEYTTPIHDNLLIFEMLISGEASQHDGVGGYLSFKGPGRKSTHPEISKLLPDENTQFTFAHGADLAAWCKGMSGPSSGVKQLTPLQEAKSRLWKLMAAVNKNEDGKAPKDWSVIHQVLWREDILDPANPDATVDKMDVPAIESMIEKIKSKPEILTP